jgi:hypothetical protein
MIVDTASDSIFNGNWVPFHEIIKDYYKDKDLLHLVLRDPMFLCNFSSGAFCRPLTPQAYDALQRLQKIDKDWVERNYYAPFAKHKACMQLPPLIEGRAKRRRSSDETVFDLSELEGSVSGSSGESCGGSVIDLCDSDDE